MGLMSTDGTPTPLDVFQKLGAWADIKMVMKYAHLAPNYTARYVGNTGGMGTEEKPEPLRPLHRAENVRERSSPCYRTSCRARCFATTTSRRCRRTTRTSSSAAIRSPGVKLRDANSGFEPVTFTEAVYRRWKPILAAGGSPWRFGSTKRWRPLRCAS
jgi:hypothetical protein